MKILLAACNAKYIHSNLAVYDLLAYASAYREHLVLKEYTINQQKDEIRKSLYLEQPDVLCFSCYIWNISFVRELAEDLAVVLPHTEIWAGGPEASYHAEEFLRENPVFRGVMVGEGEASFLELVRHYVKGAPALPEISGIAFRESGGKNAELSGNVSRDSDGTNARPENGTGEICHNGWREPLDLNDVPFPYGELTDFEHRIIYYESSRGCPFSCSYCLSSVDKHLRFRSLDKVQKELQFFLDRRVPQVKFVDRTFNCKHDHAMGIWAYIRDHDNGVTNFHFEISADLINEEELALLKTMRPGLVQLEIGVQSTNPGTIQAIRRKMDFSRLCHVSETIRSFGNIHQHLDLIAGLPWEDYGTFRKSFDDVYAMRPQQLQLGFLKVLKGSRMEAETEEYGIRFQKKEPYEVLSTRWLPYGDVLRLKTVESMVEIYYNSGQFSNTLSYLEGYFPDAFDLYERLGAFYEEKGYSALSHSRIRRYEILLEFAGEIPDVHLETLKSRMILDLYLREHLKSRPAFAPYKKEWERAAREYRRMHQIPKTAHIEALGEGRALLFDYETRDPLTHNARVEEISLEADNKILTR